MKGPIYIAFFAFIFISCNKSRQTQNSDKPLAEVITSDSIFFLNPERDSSAYFLVHTDIFDDNFEYTTIDDGSFIVSNFPYVEVEQIVQSGPIFGIRPTFWMKKGEKYEVLKDEYKMSKKPKFGPSQKIIALKSTNSAYNDDLSFINELNDSIYSNWDYFLLNGYIIAPKEGVKLDKHNMHHKSNELFEKKTSFLNKAKQKLSPEFYNLYNHLILSEYVSELISIHQYHVNDNDSIKNEVRNIILSHQQSIQNDDLLFSARYRQIINNFNAFLTTEVENKNNEDTKNNFPGDKYNLLETQKNKEINYFQRYENAKKHFTGKTLDFLLFLMIKRDYEQDGDSNQALVDSFMNDCQDENLKQYVQIMNNGNTILKSYSDLLANTDQNVFPLLDVIEKHKGKILYIDFWASWCAPCRALMPKSRELKEKYKDDVDFLYISIDENHAAWMNASKAESLDYSSNFLISKKSNFIKTMKINTIPRYMIFGRDGKIIDNNAMRPDNKDFDKKISKLINSQKKL